MYDGRAAVYTGPNVPGNAVSDLEGVGGGVGGWTNVMVLLNGANILGGMLDNSLADRSIPQCGVYATLHVCSGGSRGVRGFNLPGFFWSVWKFYRPAFLRTLPPPPCTPSRIPGSAPEMLLVKVLIYGLIIMI